MNNLTTTDISLNKQLVSRLKPKKNGIGQVVRGEISKNVKNFLKSVNLPKGRIKIPFIINNKKDI